MPGVNRATLSYEVLKKMHESVQEGKPCIFISHIRIDKDTAVRIGDYITKFGNIDVYLDVRDKELQQAAFEDNAEKITRLIEKGINESSHILCLVSESTVNSWWVPYEMGFGKRGEKDIATLTLKNTKSLPSYLQISRILRGIMSLNKYLTEITENGAFFESALIKHSAAIHPLDAYLDWQK